MSTSQILAKQVRVGVGVIIKDPRDPKRFFAGIRKGSHGAGTLALPGGHLEMMEEWEDCAKREVEEEMGITIHRLQFGHVTNDIMNDKHYVTIFMLGECTSAEERPKTMEPHKCEGWESYTWDEIKDILTKESPQLFEPLHKLVKESPATVMAFLSPQQTECVHEFHGKYTLPHVHHHTLLGT